MAYRVGSDSTFSEMDSNGNIYALGRVGVGTLIMDATSIRATSDFHLYGTHITVDSTAGLALGGNQLTQLEDGAYFGRVGISERSFDTTNFGVTWAAKGATGNWRGFAMSSDGRVQLTASYGSQLGVSSDYGQTWSAKGPTGNWWTVAMSSDGRCQTAVDDSPSGNIYDSSDYGQTWAPNGPVSAYWQAVAMSSDGRYRTAGISGGFLYVSTDYGQTWTVKGPSLNWQGLAMSSDGRVQSSGVYNGPLYVSSDYGNTWAIKDSARPWYGLAMSSDGRIQLGAVANGSPLRLSTDYGQTWSDTGPSLSWLSATMSSNGRVQFACAEASNFVYVSTDYGVTWNATGSPAGNWYGVATSSDGRVVSAGSAGSFVYVSYSNVNLTNSNLVIENKVGIGTTNPVEPLHVHGTVNALMQFTDTDSGATATSGFQVGIDANEAANLWNYGNTPMFLATNSLVRQTIDEAGNVGIGITLPTAKLHVQGDSTVVGNLSVAYDPSHYTAFSTSSAGYLNITPTGQYVYFKDGALVNVGTSPGSLVLANGVGFNSIYSDSTVPVYIGVGGAGSTSVVIASGDNLGVGCVPSAKLHVFDSTLPQVKIAYDLFHTGTLGVTSTGDLQFGTDFQVRAVIDSSGNLGIGTTTPIAPLHVIGDSTVTGNMRVDGTMSIGQGTMTLDSTGLQMRYDSTTLASVRIDQFGSLLLDSVGSFGPSNVIAGNALDVVGDFSVGNGSLTFESSTLDGTVAHTNNLTLAANGTVSVTAPSGFLVNDDMGITGWIDDGTHFRLFFTNGIVTSVTDSTAGGHS